ncbi:MAG: hypothetical protein ACTHMG_17290 [Sphingomonas sp.]
MVKLALALVVLCVIAYGARRFRLAQVRERRREARRLRRAEEERIWNESHRQ